MLSYPATIPLSTRSLNHLATLIRTHRRQRRSRWRRLDPGRQALLALAHLRNGDTLTRLVDLLRNRDRSGQAGGPGFEIPLAATEALYGPGPDEAGEI